MKLYIKQKVFSIRDSFQVYDEYGNTIFSVNSEIFTLGHRLHIFDQAGLEIAQISQKVMSFIPTYFVAVNGIDIAKIIRKMSFFRANYIIEGLDWTIDGDFFAHEFEIKDNYQNLIITVQKQWMTWGDCYEVDICPGVDVVAALAVVVAIDCTEHDKD